MFARLFLLVLCVALLAPQAGAAHAHLCLDGAGPAVTMHMGQGDTSCHHIDGSEHHDHAIEVGIDVERPAVAKTWPPSHDGALFVVVPRIDPPHRQFRILHRSPNARLAAAPLYLRPPLRGPPA